MSLTLHLHACVVDLDRRVVLRDGVTSELTPLEAALLQHLASRAGVAVPQSELLTEVWDYHPGVQSRAPTFTVNRLRAKIERDPSEPEVLLTVRGVGFRLDLPPQPLHDGLFGRQSELALLGQATQRVITLLGPGGVGKTRLAQELVRSGAVDLPGGALWVDVRAAHDREGVLAALDGLAGLNRRGACLVVLDECEHAVEPVSELLDALATEAPAARFVTTSRQRLGCAGERVLEVGPLGERDACELLRARAEAVVGRWGEGQEDVLRDLVERLDRLPLALELAAARAQLFDPTELLARLDARFRVLVDRAATGKHAALDTVIQDSWDQLEPATQRALLRLAVLQGSFDLAAAECALPAEGEAWGPDLIQGLLDHSLLQVEPESAERRFRVLESIRSWCLARLPGSERAAAEERVARHFASQSRSALQQDPFRVSPLLRNDRAHLDAALRCPDLEPEWRCWLHAARVRVARDHGGLGAALAGSRDALAPEVSDEARFHLHLARIRAQPAAEAAAEDSAAAHALAAELGSGRLTTLVEIEAASREPLPPDPTAALLCVDAARHLDDPLLLELALRTAGSQLLAAERADEAAALFEEGIAVTRSLPPRFRPPHARVNLAVAWMNLGRLEQAAEVLGALIQSEGGRASLAAGIAHIQLGRVRYCQGRLDEALSSALEGEQILRRVGHVVFASVGAQDAGAALCDLGRAGAAVHSLRRALTYFVGDPEQHWGPGLTTVFLARALLLNGEPSEARAVCAPYRTSPLQVVSSTMLGMQGLLSAVEGDLESARHQLHLALQADEPAAIRACDILFRLPYAAILLQMGDTDGAERELAVARERYAGIHHRMGLEACDRLSGRGAEGMDSSFTRVVELVRERSAKRHSRVAPRC